MEITTTTKLRISKENIGLIPVVTDSIGFKNWKSDKISKARDLAQAEYDAVIIPEPEEGEEVEPREPFVFDEESVDTSHTTFIKEFLATDAIQRQTNLITPGVDSYFGIVMKDQAEGVKGQLKEAITSEVTITE